ncbi:hypothetical protein AB4037_23290 [Labrys sp. KB_33_2]|uniref:hypothetical protein n=1 Tax=Labrys sp. KB_33_2 TaxID=3237479 RepID=UPI003F91C366
MTNRMTALKIAAERHIKLLDIRGSILMAQDPKSYDARLHQESANFVKGLLAALKNSEDR